MKHLSEIVDAARARGRKRLAVAYGQDSHTIEAVYDAYKDGLVEATLFGDKEVIEKTCAELGVDPAIFTVVDEKNPAKAVAAAVKAVAEGEADVLMKGLVSTDVYMRGILNKEATMKINIKSEVKTIMSNPDSKFNCFSWPSVARLQNGKIAVVASGYRMGHICPFGKCVMALSDDNGETYTGAFPIIDTFLDDRDAGICPFGESGVIFTTFNNSALWASSFIS